MCTFVIIYNFVSSFRGGKSCGEPFYEFFFGGGEIRVYHVEEGVAAHSYKMLFKIAYLD